MAPDEMDPFPDREEILAGLPARRAEENQDQDAPNNDGHERLSEQENGHLCLKN
jgi:hypothetical protein